MRREWSSKEEHIELNVRTRLWMFAALGLAMLPHLSRLPIWVPLFFVTVATIQISRRNRPQRQRPRWFITLLVVLVSIGIAVEFGTLLGPYAGLALLTSMITLKMLDIRLKRDVMVVVYMTYFLTVAHFIFTQSVQIACYMLAVVLVTTATLIEASYPSTRRSAGDNLRLASTLLWQALPLMIVMFIFFPRLPSRSWILPNSEERAVSGLSETMNPGSVLQLAESEEVAFRVSFEEALPPPRERYWRGPVFWYTDGRTWSAGKERHQRIINRRPSRHRYPVQHSGSSYRQTITLEPHRERWLFALDVPVTIEGRAYVASDVQWMSYSRVEERMRYYATSLTDAAIESPTIKERRRCLQLPERISPRVRELAATWAEASENPTEIVEHGLAFFAQKDFAYTLTPPPMPPDYVDAFLFDQRAGFCEHFASSFALLMRAAGVPARIVTGYMGGELNPVGNYLVIRQKDAHAWCEVWLEDRGWIRMDPIVAADPRRLSDSATTLARATEPPLLWQQLDRHIMKPMRDGLDALNNGWNQWILGYDAGLQANMMAHMGIFNASWTKLITMLLTSAAVIVALLASWMLLRTVHHEDPILAAYQQFTDKVARIGIYHQPHEGPVDFQKRICEARPDLKVSVGEVTTEYVRLRYGLCSDPQKTDQLQKLVRQFKPEGL